MCADAELTEMCRAIFGDVVKAATYQTENNVKYKHEPAVELNDKSDELAWDSEEFIIEFMNGCKVKFWNSEWATLERLKND